MTATIPINVECSLCGHQLEVGDQPYWSTDADEDNPDVEHLIVGVNPHTCAQKDLEDLVRMADGSINAEELAELKAKAAWIGQPA